MTYLVQNQCLAHRGIYQRLILQNPHKIRNTRFGKRFKGGAIHAMARLFELHDMAPTYPEAETHWVKPLIPTILGDREFLPVPPTDLILQPVSTSNTWSCLSPEP